MSRRKNCNIVRIRANDPEWIAERKNDKLVFRAIGRRRKGGLSIAKAIRALFNSDYWRTKMIGKNPASWKRKYLNRRLSVTIRKRNHTPETTVDIAPNDMPKDFIGTLCDDMPCLADEGLPRHTLKGKEYNNMIAIHPAHAGMQKGRTQ